MTKQRDDDDEAPGAAKNPADDNVPQGDASRASSIKVLARDREQPPIWRRAVFFASLTSVPFDDGAADIYGTIRADLEKRGMLARAANGTSTATTSSLLFYDCPRRPTSLFARRHAVWWRTRGSV